MQNYEKIATDSRDFIEIYRNFSKEERFQFNHEVVKMGMSQMSVSRWSRGTTPQPMYRKNIVKILKKMGINARSKTLFPTLSEI